MTDILRVLEKYDHHDGAPLSHPDIAQDIALIQNQMPQATAEEQTKATEFLTSLMGDIQNQIDDLNKQLDGKADAMEHIQKTTDACLAYMKPKGSKG